ncbi:hypothetical protein [Nostoc sp. ChiVER01]|uniref:hypothetical protein n=1 Tax=Nostoc sp. ChiVER01 TaxID=3075382 RepID=UPI002AD56CD7|nr:hypothetical protein [Nostoc sp. ChiVER01]MDZ8223904.1 hypothetical protein [Nostoc sp. ChiVER01]
MRIANWFNCSLLYKTLRDRPATFAQRLHKEAHCLACFSPLASITIGMSKANEKVYGFASEFLNWR